jgi:hypothetical protein
MPIADLTGRRFGRLVVLGRAPSKRRADGTAWQARWLCRCDCGGENTVLGNELRSGAVQSCGCLTADRARELAAAPEGQRRARRLTLPIWPKTCPTCGRDFTGTARQVYCEECASPSTKARRRQRQD